MRPYKLKHKPTGLYWQPKKHRGSHFSKTGKIYQTKANILSTGYYSDGRPREELRVWAHMDTLVYKQTKDTLPWINGGRFSEREFYVDTKAEDWEIEEI